MKLKQPPLVSLTIVALFAISACYSKLDTGFINESSGQVAVEEDVEEEAENSAALDDKADDAHEEQNIPENWRCADDGYFDQVCDCGCGAFDPACENSAIESCDQSLSCGSLEAVDRRNTLECIELAEIQASFEGPDAWTCAEAWFDDGDCDCGCGVDDPTCGVDYDVERCDYEINCTNAGLVANPEDPSSCIEGDEEPNALEGSCNILVCLTGAINQESPANADFAVICDELQEHFEILPDCSESAQCYSTWDSFSYSLFTSSWDNKVENELLPALTARLDTNNDGVVNNADEDCSLSVLGFSWGGVNSSKLASHIWADLNYSISRSQIQTMVVIDPFQPLGQEVIIPFNVEQFWSYRHSVAFDGDCSIGSTLGPYLGIAPQCHADVECTDYDYSLDLSRVYPTSGAALSAVDIGHCRVPTVAREAAKANLLHRTAFDGVLPPRVSVMVID